MNKIALVIPYFGKFNNYFHLWMESAKCNETVDFHIYTDQQIEGFANIKVHQTTLSEISDLAVRKLSKISEDNNIHNINWGGVNSPYKLCDYKPVYGLIFDEDLQDYDFWGHCDVDLIFGDIRTFITDDILNKYDRILSRGHFSLYRNNKETNLTFLLSHNNNVGIPSFETVYTSDESFAFDEWPGLSRIWRALKHDRLYDEIVFDDIAVLKGHFVSSQKIKTMDVGVSNAIFEYEKGHLYRHYLRGGKNVKQETLYAHFQKRPMSVESLDVNHYLIVPNRFIEFQEPSIQILKKYGKTKYVYFYAIKLRMGNLNRKLKHLLKRL